MSKFKDMKIKTGTPEHCKKVQEALFAAGYKWQNAAPKEPIHIDDAGWLFTYGTVGDITCDHNHTYGVRHHNEEYVLGPQGTLVSAKEYFKQPATEAKQYCHGCNALTCTGCGEAAPAESSFEERVVKALTSTDPLPKEDPAPPAPSRRTRSPPPARHPARCNWLCGEWGGYCRGNRNGA